MPWSFKGKRPKRKKGEKKGKPQGTRKQKKKKIGNKRHYKIGGGIAFTSQVQANPRKAVKAEHKIVRPKNKKSGLKIKKEGIRVSREERTRSLKKIDNMEWEKKTTQGLSHVGRQGTKGKGTLEKKKVWEGAREKNTEKNA